MTVRIIDIVHGKVDQTSGDGSTETSFATGSDAVGTTTPHYASLHFGLDVAVDSELGAYVSLGKGTAGGNDTTVGICEDMPNKGYIWFWYLNSEGGHAPIVLVATTQRYGLDSGWSLENKGGGIGPNSDQLLSPGNYWWWGGGYDQPYSDDTPSATNPGTWINMNNFFKMDQYDSATWAYSENKYMVGGAVRDPKTFHNIYYWLPTNTYGNEELVRNVTGATQEDVIDTMKSYGYTYIGQLELIPKQGGGNTSFIYVAGGIFYNDERKASTTWGTRSATLQRTNDPNDGYVTLYWHSSITQSINIFGYPIEIPNVDEYLDQDYYPWAIRKTIGAEETWQSCNRTPDGSVKILADAANDTWRDCKNGGPNPTVHQLSDNETEWAVCPKIGLNQ